MEDFIVNYWLLTLSLLNILLMSLVLFSWLFKNKNKLEEQKLSKGLQLLQNKISILQDLADRSDEQVRKWVYLIEQKSTDLQNLMNIADEKIGNINKTLDHAIEVTQVFYDKTPQATLMERLKTSKYVHAAKLANQGFSSEIIAQKIDLSMAEIELIIKLNKDQLQFSENQLPAWILAGNDPHIVNQVDNNETLEPFAEAKSDLETLQNSEQRIQEINDFKSQLTNLRQTSANTASTQSIFHTQNSQTLQNSSDPIINNLVNEQIEKLYLPELNKMHSLKKEMEHSLSINNLVTNILAVNTSVPQTFIEDTPISELKVEKPKQIEIINGKTIRPFEFKKIPNTK